MAERSHPASEAGAAPEAMAVAGRSNPTPEARASTGSSNPKPKARGGGREGQPHVQGVVAVWVQEGVEEPSHVEGQEERREEIPLIQGKEQWLCFAGAAVKRYPTPKVRENQVK